jgi:hypothetical protein
VRLVIREELLWSKRKAQTEDQSLFGSVADRCKLHVAITLCHISTGAVPNLLWNLKLAFDDLLDEFRAS